MAFTYFFRDAPTLELLIERALPALRGQAFIRLWDAGCANGAEPYTLAMLLREKMPDFMFDNVRIHATDIDGQFGPQIAAGLYPEQEVKRIPYVFRYRYFQVTDEPGYVQVVDEIRSKVSFARHDLLSLAPPRDDFSLIVCKNVLLHFDAAERRQVFRMFHGAMRVGGLLATEQTQKMPEGFAGLFEPLSSCAQVYRRLDAPEQMRAHIDGSHELRRERMRRETFRTHHV